MNYRVLDDGSNLICRLKRLLQFFVSDFQSSKTLYRMLTNYSWWIWQRNWLCMWSLLKIFASHALFNLSVKTDGLSLLVSALHHWLSFGDRCPHVLLSTHFHSLTNNNLLPNTKLIEYLVGWVPESCGYGFFFIITLFFCRLWTTLWMVMNWCFSISWSGGKPSLVMHLK